jgi:hypothetical protein
MASSEIYRSAVAVTPGTPVRAGDGVGIACTAEGFVGLLMDGGGIYRQYVYPGPNQIDGLAVSGVDVSTTTAAVVVTILRKG